MRSIDEQSRKVESSILVIPLGMFMFLRFLQPENAEYPIEVTVSGSTTVSSVSKFLNVSLAIVVPPVIMIVLIFLRTD